MSLVPVLTNALQLIPCLTHIRLAFSLAFGTSAMDHLPPSLTTISSAPSATRTFASDPSLAHAKLAGGRAFITSTITRKQPSTMTPSLIH